MGVYRKAEFDKPDVFVTALAVVFASYPLQHGVEIVSPLVGLPARMKFPPAISEVKEALDALGERRRILAHRAQQELADRAQQDKDRVANEEYAQREREHQEAFQREIDERVAARRASEAHRRDEQGPGGNDAEGSAA